MAIFNLGSIGGSGGGGGIAEGSYCLYDVAPSSGTISTLQRISNIKFNEVTLPIIDTTYGDVYDFYYLQDGKIELYYGDLNTVAFNGNHIKIGEIKDVNNVRKFVPTNKFTAEFGRIMDGYNAYPAVYGKMGNVDIPLVCKARSSAYSFTLIRGTHTGITAVTSAGSHNYGSTSTEFDYYKLQKGNCLNIKKDNVHKGIGSMRIEVTGSNQLEVKLAPWSKTVEWIDAFQPEE